VGLNAETPEQRVYADMAVYANTDVYFAFRKTFEGPDKQDVAEKNYFENVVPAFLNKLEFILKDKKFLTGDKVSKEGGVN